MGEQANFGKEKPITWYFEDNFGLKLDLQKSLILASYGKTFTQSVYDTENYFKTKIEPKISAKKSLKKKEKKYIINWQVIKNEKICISDRT